ncbi:DUF1501 domain-containing protein [Sphingomonas sanguinis]|uniref:DUF1501 domain-containing protein n=1 Tax=Sphingomonas sp. LC-1 TaxID=3110957 RepID=UPI0021BBB21E|nr:DUF1501 domain-containing protein [Sphingomonas sp. LC-1]MCT8000829.1 DUF1501 domain-containing protein [Sphingomonas sp. LC-1]
MSMMQDQSPHDQSRRAFLKRSALLGLAGTATPFVSSLAAIGEAAAATASDYKALVCVFLYGGNDYANTLVPYDEASFSAYRTARANIGYQRDALAGTVLSPSVALPDGRAYALSPSMPEMSQLFAAGKMAVALNVGTLVEPTSKSQYQRRSVQLPPKLFSHNDQQSFFQASSPEGAGSGWGGRIGDVFQNGNGNAALTCINTSGNAVYLTGRNAIQYSVGTGGPIALLNSSRTLYGSSSALDTLRALMTTESGPVMASEHARISKRALDIQAQLSGALAGAPAANFPLFPSSNSLADQLKMVARMISVNQTLGLKRQVFFVSMGGFDLHDNLVAQHPGLLAKLSAAMKAFYDTTAALGLANQVTSFTASDFGRTLQSNDDGSDHGWGGMHFIVGGAVRGQRFYGKAPIVGTNTDDDVGQGRLIPTMSVDQYAATLASWFGIDSGGLRTVLPNIGNYDASTWNQGFMG